MKELLTKYINNQCTAEEVHQLLDFFGIEKNEEDLKKVISDYLERTDDDVSENHPAIQSATQAAYKKLAQSLHAQPIDKKGRVISMRRNYFYRIAAAAVVVLAIGTGVYYLTKDSSPKQLAQNNPAAPVKADVAPGGNKAVLTLADGSQIILDSAKEGTITEQGTVKVIKLNNGQIAYNGGVNARGEMQYNTISTPRGGQYKVILSDGTEVWLNAASSIRYPTAFAGTTRNVEIAGEVYFEVAKDKTRPFVVKKTNDAATIQVLGTHFNVNAYDDEADMKVTLLEGSVKVAKGSSENILKPGQQAILRQTAGNGINVINDVDVEEVMAWKNGRFDFGEKANIEDIMRQLARWYDVDVEYRGKVTQQFWGSVPRDVNAGEVFKKLEATGGVHFKIEGKKVIVMP